MNVSTNAAEYRDQSKYVKLGTFCFALMQNKSITCTVNISIMIYEAVNLRATEQTTIIMDHLVFDVFY